MRSVASLCIWTFVVLIPATAAGVEEKVVDELARDALKAFDTPGLAILVVKDDKVVYVKGFGVREVGKQDAVTPDTLFAIASCTKAFTAAAIGLLVEDGKMKWDDPLGKHLPGFHLKDPLADREVTVRDSLTHRHGLSRHDALWIKTPWSREELLQRIAHLPPNTSFRSTFEYNNLLYLAAGEAAGRAAGTSWEELIQKRIFNPLEMKTASLSVKAAAANPDRALPHRHRDDDRKVETFAWDGIDNVAPAGSIIASVRDLAPWLRMHLGGGRIDGWRFMSAPVLKEMHTPQVVVRLEGRWPIFFPPAVTNQVSYGLGWFISDYRGRHCLSHGGTLEGFRAQIVLFPKDKLGIAVLSNLGGCRLPEALTKSLADRYLQIPETERTDWNEHYLAEDAKTLKFEKAMKAKRAFERKPGTKPSLPLKDYAGKYADAAYGEITVSFDKGELNLSWGSFADRLQHFHFDTFSCREPYRTWPDDRVTFRLDAMGRVENLHFLGRDFTRQKP